MRKRDNRPLIEVLFEEEDTMHAELRKACALLSGGVTELGHTEPEPTPAVWYRVDANYAGPWVLVGEASDRIGYLALADRAWKDRAQAVRIYRCESVP